MQTTNKRSTTSLDKLRLILIEMGNNLKNKKSIVYLTINLVNSHIYVGVHDTEDPYKWDGYYGDGLSLKCKNVLKHPKTPFHYAVKKYGFDAFKRFTLAVFNSRKEALDLEGVIVNEEFISRDDTYNIVVGGGDPPHYTRSCYRYSLDGTFIQEYPSLTIAAKDCNL